MKSGFIADRQKARLYGISLVDEFAWENEQMGMTELEKIQVLSALEGVTMAILVGSLAAAKLAMGAVTPIPTLLTQERIDRYELMIQNLIDNI